MGDPGTKPERPSPMDAEGLRALDWKVMGRLDPDARRSYGAEYDDGLVFLFCYMGPRFSLLSVDADGEIWNLTGISWTEMAGLSRALLSNTADEVA